MSKKSTIIIAVVVLLVLAVIGGGFFMMWQKLTTLNAPRPAEAEHSSAKNEQHDGIGPVFPLDAFIVNLSDQGGKRYLRITMSLELADAKLAEELTKRLPQIRDAILTILPTRKVDDLQSAEGKNALRNEIISSLNGLMGKEAVKKIYITEFVIQ